MIKIIFATLEPSQALTINIITKIAEDTKQQKENPPFFSLLFLPLALHSTLVC